MSKIKSLADQLRSRLDEEKAHTEVPVPAAQGDEGRSSVSSVSDGHGPDCEFEQLISAMREFSLSGTEKIVIRLDARTMVLLRRLKLVSGIDMTRVIVFSLSEFLRSHPRLNEYISITLNQFEP